MDSTLIAALVLFVGVLALLASGIWVAMSLLIAGFVGLAAFTPAAAGQMLASNLWDASWSWALTALPLFVWMGEILSRTSLSADLFRGLAPWVSWLPGRLMHVNIVGCGLMAAITGSSAVTCATVGRISIPELRKRGYDENMMIGTLAGAGTFGLLIPPSIIMIVYGVIAQQSVARLFIAGIVPGIMLILMYMAYVGAWSLIYPERTPPREPKLAFVDKLRNSSGLIPVALLIAGVVGAIYTGYATPTESATIGVIGSLILAAASGTLNWKSFLDSLLAATRISCMINLIIATAACLSIAVGFIDIPRVLSEWVGTLGLSAYGLLAVLTGVFLFLGCFLEGISILVLSAPVVLPLVQAAGIDLMWFGIFMVIIIEIAQITPPVGFNLFVLQGMTGRSIGKVIRATVPFFLLLLAAIVLITAFPPIVTWLPRMMIQR
jgi:C4-dicarboxylate transporter, DctM subunit